MTGTPKRRLLPRGARGVFWASKLHARQASSDEQPAGGDIFGADAAAVGPDDALANGQSQAGDLPPRVGGIQRLENLLEQRRRHTPAVVLKQQHQLLFLLLALEPQLQMVAFRVLKAVPN